VSPAEVRRAQERYDALLTETVGAAGATDSPIQQTEQRRKMFDYLSSMGTTSLSIKCERKLTMFVGLSMSLPLRTSKVMNQSGLTSSLIGPIRKAIADRRIRSSRTLNAFDRVQPTFRDLCIAKSSVARPGLTHHGLREQFLQVRIRFWPAFPGHASSLARSTRVDVSVGEHGGLARRVDKVCNVIDHLVLAT
jgi:hypothetical protein